MRTDLYGLAALLFLAGVAGCSAPARGPDLAAATPACNWLAHVPATFEHGDWTLEFSKGDCTLGLAAASQHIGSVVRPSVFTPVVPLLSARDAVTPILYQNGSIEGDRPASPYSGVARSVGIAREPSTRQWASQGRDERGPVPQVTGEPDTFPTQANTTAWLTTSGGGDQWLEVTFATPTIPVELRVWEWETPGFVARVEAFVGGAQPWVDVWAGNDYNTKLPGYFEAKPLALLRPASQFRIHPALDYDKPVHGVDAVELLGATSWTFTVRAEIDRGPGATPLLFGLAIDTSDGAVMALAGMGVDA